MFADNWCLRSNGRTYGPYSSRDLKKFAHEGRFAAWSLIAPAGSREFRRACEEPAFAELFDADAPSVDARALSAIEQRTDEGALVSAAEPRRARPLGSAARRNPPTEQTGPSNFVIVFDVVSAAATRVENALRSLGSAFRLADNVWAVNCTLTAIGVRNALAPFLRPHETLFVIDATNGRTSWQNYAPEAHAKITQAFVHARGQ